ncbi:MAG TPA: hypothetical protein VJB96_05200 [Patescibacteria group bacterium]|nr:hypothetical protein [Patescibacteria group bacterium]
MSEQTINTEMGSPKDRAIAYLEARQHGKVVGKRTKDIKAPVVPEKVRRKDPLVDTVTAYEKVIDRLGEKGYEGLQQKFEGLRSFAYDAAQVVQWGARAADFAITAAVLFAPVLYPRVLRRSSAFGGPWPVTGARFTIGEFLTRPRHLLVRGAGVYGMMRFRPLEWATAQVAKIGGAVVSSDAVAPIVNNILGGGERVEPAKAKQVLFGGAKPQAV